jgi:uncharacterized protein YukE
VSEWIRVDAVTLRATQARFDDLAGSVTSIAARLGSALDAEGPCWGGDEAGDAFASEYLAASAALRSLLTGTSSDIRDLGVAIGRAADAFAVIDDEVRGVRSGD